MTTTYDPSSVVVTIDGKALIGATAATYSDGYTNRTVPRLRYPGEGNRRARREAAAKRRRAR